MEMLIMKSETELESFIRNTAAAAAIHSTTLWGPPYDDDDAAPPDYGSRWLGCAPIKLKEI